MGHRWQLLIAAMVLACACATAFGARPADVEAFESSAWTTPANVVDAQVTAALAKRGVQLRNPCSDGVFVRRVYLDVIGTLPPPREVDAFLKDQSPNKRSALIDSLLARDEFADYWAMKWCDILRVKSEFPINLWPNAVQAYHHWIREAIRDNMPYDRFARQMLTSSGSNFRVPPVNFYRAVPSRDPASIAKGVALTFMGTRIERWPQARRDAMAAFFSQIQYKKTGEWKEEIVQLNPTAGAVNTTYPDGTKAKIPAGSDPRQAFADWLICAKNPWFAENVVNRLWGWLMGRGIVDEVDDIRPDNPPASPEVLACLEKELIQSHYDLRHIYRLILNSRTYQQSSIPHGDTSDPKVQFAHYQVRQLDAEVLIDALSWISGEGEGYSSAVPEPYTFIPADQRAISLADASMTSSFLTTFGRPSRDTGMASERNNQPTDTQRLYMLNSSDIQRRIMRSPLLRTAMNPPRRDQGAVARRIYLILLSRYPTQAEEKIVADYFQKQRLQHKDAMDDLAWALINSKEFLYRH